MEKEQFILIANKLREAQPLKDTEEWVGWKNTVEAVADSLKQIDPHFMKYRWLGYIHGENGASGGSRTGEGS